MFNIDQKKKKLFLNEPILCDHICQVRKQKE